MYGGEGEVEPNLVSCLLSLPDATRRREEVEKMLKVIQPLLFLMCTPLGFLPHHHCVLDSSRIALAVYFEPLLLLAEPTTSSISSP